MMPSWRRCSFSFSLLFLAVILGVVIHAHGAVAARPLRGIVAEPPAAAGPGAAAQAGGGGRQHDRSEAGAEVILAGFAAAVMVVIFCYIRVTRKNNGSGRVGLDRKPESLGGF
ncbi:hypothetical protein PR202_gb07145 [Eleusine coracana subsp. coracana]|uniref:Uncharacterized protein n=1 Tax=Eleusine coracana subsp. coracana TaxID=191504 RepID=A0AAV5EBG0_ELECO|nr:hypothetical protein QOZ80_2BG0166480 [Eleusine coracana subsp. coracana]GJN19834.1 hypothetical protein PR202_gb07145 [Eleusine coracana subsp. coracana]